MALVPGPRDGGGGAVAGARVDHRGAADRPSQRQRDRGPAEGHRRAAVAVDLREAVEGMGGADAIDGPALAFLDDHGVQSGAGEGAGGEGPAGSRADHDRVAARGAGPLGRRGDVERRIWAGRLVPGADRGNLRREGVGPVGQHRDRLDRVEDRRAPAAGEPGQQLLAPLGRERAERSAGAGEREGLQPDQGCSQAGLGDRRHLADHPPRDRRGALGVRPPGLRREQRRHEVSQRGHGGRY